MKETAPDVRALQMLGTVLETGSMNAAAKLLGVTQQAISARMQSIETRLGLDLLRRSTAGIQPTETGRLVATWAQDLIDAANTFSARIDALTRQERPAVRVAASLTIAEHLLPGWLLAWRAELAQTAETAVANSAEVVDMVRQGMTDLGFIETVEVPQDLNSQLLAHDELILVVQPGHPWARSGAVRLIDVSRTRLVVHESGSGTRGSLDRLARAQLGGRWQPVEPALVASTSAGIRAAAISGVGPAVISTLAVRDDIALGRLVHVPISDARLVRPLTAIWSSLTASNSARTQLLQIARRPGAL